MKINKAVASYWLKHYVAILDPGVCILCANSGRISLGFRRSAAGHNFGPSSEFCFCPNGQTLRHHHVKVQKGKA